MSQDARSLQEEIRREIDKLIQEAQEAQHCINRGEPNEAKHTVNNGRETIKIIQQRWEDLHNLIEHLG